MAPTTNSQLLASVGETIDFWPMKALEPIKGEWQKLRCRFINALPDGQWDDFILSEWELESCGWEDFHPHSETNFLLEGELHIESEGKSVTLRPGDSARVNPGHLGRYIAPVYARMFTVYGPNPEGLKSHSFRYFEL